jgi:3-hydroxyisobutyrate dehydrogenase-like beta-hydroxyacid dehydrogenase
MGSAVARCAARDDIELTTCVSDRSPRTRRNALDAGMVAAERFEDAVEGTVAVISLVPQSQAVALAERYADCLAGSERGAARPIYVDANSIAPDTLARIAACVTAAGADCIDVSVIGPASQLGRTTLLLASGPRVGELRELLGPKIEVRDLGPEIGTASAAKLAFSVMTKSMMALGLEMYSAAGRIGQANLIAELLERFYPETAAFLDRNLPTFPVHLARRTDEMKEVEHWLHSIGQAGTIACATRRLFEDLALVPWDRERACTVPDVVDAVAGSGALSLKTPRE